MTITLTPEHERIIEARIAAGQFHSVEELLDQALIPFKPSTLENATEEKAAQAQAAAEQIRELRKGVTLERPEGMSLREYAHIGHKY